MCVVFLRVGFCGQDRIVVHGFCDKDVFWTRNLHVVAEHFDIMVI